MSAASEVRFFDSSAVVKRYLNEQHSGQVSGWLTPGAAVVSRLAEVEVPSAFSRGLHAGMLSAEQSERVLSSFRADLVRWEVVELTPEVVSTAIRLLWQHPLRAADAIQLGAALVFERAMGKPLQGFVAYDQRLADAARHEGLTVVGA